MKKFQRLAFKENVWQVFFQSKMFFFENNIKLVKNANK